jgi:DNA-binding XRE family transcriptional regulator
MLKFILKGFKGLKDTTITIYRKKAKISQQKLSELLNLPRTTISFFETKRQYPDFKTAQKISEILNTTIGKLWADYELELILRKEQ